MTTHSRSASPNSSAPPMARACPARLASPYSLPGTAFVALRATISTSAAMIILS
ncbi:hypothetical protein [Amycolatopsis sp.]|uniref:hypothetical protein n=1 Tax=Amycolatopsis sp. TaxID=37632 RepID=UPI002CAE5156|nr:hypothetical protein [Amycolatopsis sp.]HVV13239.1 hypothetical protein [Amycolatopsis sp.]